jgi:Zn-dependent alcohol dehydrogenase
MVAASGAFGATAATAPGKAALEAVRAVAPGGADVVLEMVGHNQEMGIGKWGIGEVEILLGILRLP